MTRRKTFALVLMVVLSIAALASTNPNGVPEWLLQRATSKVRIDVNGVVRIEPRTGQGVIVSGKLVANSVNFCADAGSTDAYACSLVPAITAYATGQQVWFKANTVNTGAATINLNALGAKTIKKVAGGITTDLATNDIRAGQYVQLQYDGTNFQMLSASGNSDVVTPSLTVGSGTALTRLAYYTATLSPAAVGANTCAEELFTVTGITAGDVVFVNKPTAQAGLGLGGVRASGANQVGINFCNNTAAPITPTASQAYLFGVMR